MPGKVLKIFRDWIKRIRDDSKCNCKSPDLLSEDITLFYEFRLPKRSLARSMANRPQIEMARNRYPQVFWQLPASSQVSVFTWSDSPRPAGLQRERPVQSGFRLNPVTLFDHLEGMSGFLTNVTLDHPLSSAFKLRSLVFIRAEWFGNARYVQMRIR